MLPASNRGAGQNMGFPDVCLTPAPPAPPVPVPYPNIALNAQAVAFSQVVKISGVNALNLGSSIPMTSGDEGGASHPTIKGQGKYTMGNPIVNIDRLPAICLALPTTGNMMNNGLGVVAVPSAVNVMLCLAQGAGEAEASVQEVTEIAEALRSPGVRAERLPAGVALVTVPIIAPGLATDVFRALQALGGAAALVLDLRGNPGGDLGAALALAEVFVPDGAPLARVRERDGDERVVHARGGPRHDQPLVVLVDRRTASAAEVLASALQANGRAIVVGERTHGKASVQQVMAAPGGDGGLRVDVARWTAPDPSATEGGVTPDVELLPPLEQPTTDEWLRTAWALALRAAG